MDGVLAVTGQAMAAGAPFGQAMGRMARRWTLSDGGACTATVTDFGARLVSLVSPDADGRPGNIVLGHDSAEDYVNNRGTCMGAVCGRVANRIRGAAFRLDGTLWPLDRNEGPNHLHGGYRGFDVMPWNVQSASPSRVALAAVSPHGDGGYPGTLHLAATYAFTAPGRLDITLQATAMDRPSVVNMVHHGYFNLSGGGTITGHRLRVAARRVVPVDDALLPVGDPVPVDGTDCDFRQPRPIGTGPGGRGHDMCLCLDSPPGAPAAELTDPASGRRLRLFTDRPGLQVYTAGGFPGGLTGRGGQPIPRFGGIALEAGAWPDAPNRWPGQCRIDPGQTITNRLALQMDRPAR
jgi:aldose 1-epimerase